MNSTFVEGIWAKYILRFEKKYMTTMAGILKFLNDVYMLVSKLKKTKIKFLRCTGYLNSIKTPIKQDLLLILVLVQPQNFLNFNLMSYSCSNMLSSNVKRYMRDPVKICIGLFKIQVKFWKNLKLEISMRPVCLLMIFRDAFSVVRPTGVYLLDFFCSGIQFYLLLSPYLCVISFLYRDSYVLGDDALIS